MGKGSSGLGSSGTGGSGGYTESAISRIYQLKDDNNNEIGRLFEINGAVYLLRKDGSINELPNTFDLNGYLNNVRNNGGSTQVISKKQLKQEEEAQKAYRDQINALLNQAYVHDKVFVKGSKASLTGFRVAKKKH